MFVCIALIILLSSFRPLEKARETWLWPTADGAAALQVAVSHFRQEINDQEAWSDRRSLGQNPKRSRLGAQTWKQMNHAALQSESAFWSS